MPASSVAATGNQPVNPVSGRLQRTRPVVRSTLVASVPRYSAVRPATVTNRAGTGWRADAVPVVPSSTTADRGARRVTGVPSRAVRGNSPYPTRKPSPTGRTVGSSPGANPVP